MKRWFTFFLLFFTVGSISAQIIDNSNFGFLSDEPFFDESYISKNNIQKITGNYSIKADLDKIRDSDRVYEYQFDKKGRLTSKWTTFYYDNKIKDTTITLYEYDNNNRVKSIRKSDNYGYYSHHFKYNEKGDVIFEEFRRDYSHNHNKNNFDLDSSFTVTKEKSTYQYFDGQTKRTYYNDEGKPYQYTIYYYNEDQQLVEEYTQLEVNTGYQKITYQYDEKGYPKEKVQISKMMTPTEKRFEYQYDEHGNLLSVQKYKNDQHTTDVQIVYSWKTNLLKAFLTKKLNTNYITILKFDFEYFDDTTQNIKD